MWSFLIRDGEVLRNQIGTASIKKRPDEGHIGDKCDFLLLTTVSTSKGI